MRARLPALLAMAVVLATVPVAPARASCAPPPPLEESIADATSVFAGRVVDLRSRGTVAAVRVDEVWKGPDVAPVVGVRGGQEQPGGLAGLFTAVSSSNDYEFVAGRGYLFVLDGSFRVGQCGGVMPLAAGQSALRPTLVRGPADEGLQGVPLPEADVWKPVLLGGLLLVMLLVVGFVVLRRRSSEYRRSEGA